MIKLYYTCKSVQQRLGKALETVMLTVMLTVTFGTCFLICSFTDYFGLVANGSDVPSCFCIKSVFFCSYYKMGSMAFLV